MEIIQYYQKKNPCYKAGKTITPSGIIVHSTGANNPNLKRYVGPDDGILGHNKNNNHWNNASANKCVHAFIGKAADGSLKIYQTLPWNWRCWGVGSGKKGSYNATHIQFEICEDGLTDETYYREAFDLAKQLCAFLCKKYGIDTDNIVGHYEAAKAGYGSNHADPQHWQKKHGGSMDQFRAEVKAMLGQTEQITVKEQEKPKATGYTIYTVKKGDSLWKIAKDQLGSGNRYKEIMTASGIKNDLLKVGQKIKIPKA